MFLLGQGFTQDKRDQEQWAMAARMPTPHRFSVFPGRAASGGGLEYALMGLTTATLPISPPRYPPTQPSPAKFEMSRVYIQGDSPGKP